jgi:NADH-dependent peroxiredoxin subunit F
MTRPSEPDAVDPLMYELVVIGCGPAGLAAAFFAVRQRMRVAVVGRELGGQAIHSTHVENYLGFDAIAGEALVERFAHQLAEQFVEFLQDDVERIEQHGDHLHLALHGGADMKARTVILATGMAPNRLGVPGEVELTGHGVSYFADHYGPTAHDQNVLVIGGGNSGLQAVQEVAPVAASVQVLTRGGWTGDPDRITAVQKFANVEMLAPAAVRRIEGDGRVERVVIAPTDSDAEQTLPIDLIFVEIGFRPATAIVKDLVELNDHGEVIVDRENLTRVPGLFAAGDCTSGTGKEIAIATGDGARAALSAKRFVRSRSWVL